MDEHRDVETGEVPVPVALIEQTLAGENGERTDGGTGPWPYLASGGPPTDPTPEDAPAVTAAGREGAGVREER
jgi:hypothetical protein